MSLPLALAARCAPSRRAERDAIALRLVDHYPPLEALERRALGRAGVALHEPGSGPGGAPEAAPVAVLFGIP